MLAAALRTVGPTVQFVPVPMPVWVSTPAPATDAWSNPTLLIGIVVWGYVAFETTRRVTEYINTIRAELIRDRTDAESDGDWYQRRKLAFRRDWIAWNEATLGFLILNAVGLALVGKALIATDGLPFALVALMYCVLALFGIWKLLGGYRHSRWFIRLRLVHLYCNEDVDGRTGRSIRVVAAKHGRARRDFQNIHAYITGRDGRIQSERRREERALLQNIHAFLSNVENYQLFTAYADDQPVGRISVHIPSGSNDQPVQLQKRQVWFGFFDSIESSRVAAALLKAALDWAKQYDVTEIQGPFSWSIHGRAGVQVSGFLDDSYPLVAENPPYYAQILEDAGAEPIAIGHAWRYWMSKYLPKPIDDRARTQDRAKYALDTRDLEPADFIVRWRTERVYKLINERYANRLGFARMEADLIRGFICDAAPLMDPALSFMVTAQRAGEAQREDVGVVIASPNYIDMDAHRSVAWARILQWFRSLALRFAADPDAQRYTKRGIRLAIANRLIARPPPRRESDPEDPHSEANEPDVSRSARVMLLALKNRANDSELKELLGYVFRHLHNRFHGGGYGKVEFSITLETDQSIIRTLEELGARRYKEYRFYRFRAGQREAREEVA